MGLPVPGAELSELIHKPWADAGGSAHQPPGLPSASPAMGSFCMLSNLSLPSRAGYISSKT